MGKVGLITLHGMGETERDYARKLFDEIEERVPSSKYPEIVKYPVFYQDIMQDNQESYLQEVKQDVEWDWLRRFMLYGFSDAATLESFKSGNNSPYYLAQKAILLGFQSIYTRAGGAVPTIIVAQSLGGQVITNYLYDAGQTASTPDNGVWSSPPPMKTKEEDFCRGKSVHRLFTTGCNIPLFVGGRSKKQIKPIDPTRFGPSFEWHNYYDKDDVLGWPLSPLSPAYSFVKDHRMNAGGVFSSSTPFSHTRYWTDKDFVRPLVKTLEAYL
ncbi:MAG: hypothetical protein AAFR65_01130 [Pseudomonadota bacterium]